MCDISNREDIVLLVEYFYAKAMKDKIIGHFFTSVIRLNLEIHIPRICDFWETVLFGSLNFKGNPMSAHIALNEKSRLTEEHFAQWLKLWDKSVDNNFAGPKAAEAKQRAKSIAGLMKYKIDQTK